jgi:poly-gamma-glutamate synthesis protein (capsule biosynthesis protein)
MYFASVDPRSGKLVELHLVPTRMKGFRVTRAPEQDASWLRDLLEREGARWGTRADLRPDGTVAIGW